MTIGIFQLPAELHCNIANHLDKEDARSFRLSCKTFHTAGTQTLFSFVRLYPCEESVARYNSILGNPEINKWVRHVELNTMEKDKVGFFLGNHALRKIPLKRAKEDEEQGESPDLSEEFETAFESFPDFTNLNSVALRFAPNATSGNSWGGLDHWNTWSEWPQDYHFRQPLIQEFFKTLAKPSASKINRICVDNIQNINDRDGDFMTSDTVVNVLSRLRALQLVIITEDHEPSPENNLKMVELHTFMKELPSLWLQPAANTLTTLVLYQTFYFGYSPKLDLRDVHFPNLRTLALGNYVFTHDWQLDWLSSHSTLENLYLDDCIVLYFACLLDSPLDEDGYPVIQTFPGAGGTTRGPATRGYQFIDMTWSKIFTHIRKSLPSLLKFRVGTSPRWNRRGRNAFDRLDYEQTSIRLNVDRYQMFDGGIGPCQYTDEFTRRESENCSAVDLFNQRFNRQQGDPEVINGGDEARRFLGRLKEQEQEDKAALIELLKGIRHPVTEDTVKIQKPHSYSYDWDSMTEMATSY
ncbi:hypothetical protein OQA88_2308 [Cercophora sp. LCS_1]